jgi:hypothetical protein
MELIVRSVKMTDEHHPFDLEGRKTIEQRAGIEGEFRTAPEMLEFIREVYEIAFGENAYNRGFYKVEVLQRLRNYSDKSYLSEQYEELKNG